MLDMFKKQSNQSTITPAVSNQEISAVLDAKVETHRFVTLRASSCCACGCSDIDIKRKVPMDSHLQDGDFVGSDIHSDDEIL